MNFFRQSTDQARQVFFVDADAVASHRDDVGRCDRDRIGVSCSRL